MKAEVPLRAHDIGVFPAMCVVNQVVILGTRDNVDIQIEVLIGSSDVGDMRLLDDTGQSSLEGRPVIARWPLRIPEIEEIGYHRVVRRPLEGGGADLFTAPEVAADYARLIYRGMVPLGSVEMTYGAEHGNHPLRTLLMYGSDRRRSFRRERRGHHRDGIGRQGYGTL